MQWIQDPRESNVDNLNNVRREASRHFRNKKKGYLKAKTEELETNNRIQNIGDLYMGINDFKKGYQPRTNTARDKKDDLVADSRSIFVRRTKYFSLLLNVLGVIDVRQTDIITAEPPVPKPSASEIELDIEKLKIHKSPGIDQISAELINSYPTAFPYGNGMVLHFYQQQESSTTKTVHKVINRGLKTYV